MHGVARRDDQRALLQAEAADYDFEIMVPRQQQDEVVMGRNVAVYVSELGVGAVEITSEYSHDFTVFAADADFGPVNVPLGTALTVLVLAAGTNTRIRVTALDVGGALIDVECHLV